MTIFAGMFIRKKKNATGSTSVHVIYKAFQRDNKWNGLKGYVTNCHLSESEIMDNYKHLWAIEKAFRISKTDLRVRPIFHRLERRIKTHICIAFCAYKVYKELERQLKVKNVPLSTDQTLAALRTMYQAEVILPKSKQKTKLMLPLEGNQRLILKAFEIEF